MGVGFVVGVAHCPAQTSLQFGPLPLALHDPEIIHLHPQSHLEHPAGIDAYLEQSVPKLQVPAGGAVGVGVGVVVPLTLQHCIYIFPQSVVPVVPGTGLYPVEH